MQYINPSNVIMQSTDTHQRVAHIDNVNRAPDDIFSVGSHHYIQETPDNTKLNVVTSPNNNKDSQKSSLKIVTDINLIIGNKNGDDKTTNGNIINSIISPVNDEESSVLSSNPPCSQVSPPTGTPQCTNFLDNYQSLLVSPIILPPSVTPKPVVAAKRPSNSWILYRRDKHSVVLSSNPEMSNNQISKIIAHMWKNEVPEVRDKYRMKAVIERNYHKTMYPDYKYAPRKNKNKRNRNSLTSKNAQKTTTDTVNNPQNIYIPNTQYIQPPPQMGVHCSQLQNCHEQQQIVWNQPNSKNQILPHPSQWQSSTPLLPVNQRNQRADIHLQFPNYQENVMSLSQQQISPHAYKMSQQPTEYNGVNYLLDQYHHIQSPSTPNPLPSNSNNSNSLHDYRMNPVIQRDNCYYIPQQYVHPQNNQPQPQLSAFPADKIPLQMHSPPITPQYTQDNIFSDVVSSGMHQSYQRYPLGHTIHNEKNQHEDTINSKWKP